MMNDTMNIINSILRFFENNWIDLLLIGVGTLALVVYILQERKKRIEAASLVIMQIDEIMDRIKQIKSFIVNSQLNETAFYESQKLFEENYWNRYKHYFVRKMSSRSFRTLNSLYECANEIQEQQQLMKNLQKNFFFVTQQVLANLETNYIITCLNNSSKYSIDIQQVVTGLTQTIPQDMEPAQKKAIENMIHQFADTNGNIDFSTFWNNYNKNRSNIISIIDQNGLTSYTPLQIKLSLEKALNQYMFLDVSSCDGYKILLKISKKEHKTIMITI